MKIQPLTSVGTDELFDAFSNAFSEYERTWSHDEFERLLKRRGYVPELSFGAFDNDMLAGFVINGIGEYGGKLSAYDAGTGTIKEYRGQGLTSHMLQEVLSALKAKGISQYVLEVLQHNDAAVSIYNKAGFKVLRELDYFVNKADDIIIKPHEMPTHCTLRSIDAADIKQALTFHDYPATWQNDYAAIMREPSYFSCTGAYAADVLVGYGVIEPDTGDIPQLAVKSEHRRKGLASAIFQTLIGHNKHDAIKIINTDSSYKPMADFLAAHGLQRKGRQYEMALSL